MCDHSPPQFNCKYCVEQRGKLYLSKFDYQLNKLNETRLSLEKWYDRNDVSDSLIEELDIIIDDLNNVICEIVNEASVNTNKRFNFNYDLCRNNNNAFVSDKSTCV